MQSCCSLQHCLDQRAGSTSIGAQAGAAAAHAGLADLPRKMKPFSRKQLAVLACSRGCRGAGSASDSLPGNAVRAGTSRAAAAATAAAHQDAGVVHEEHHAAVQAQGILETRQPARGAGGRSVAQRLCCPAATTQEEIARASSASPGSPQQATGGACRPQPSETLCERHEPVLCSGLIAASPGSGLGFLSTV